MGAGTLMRCLADERGECMLIPDKWSVYPGREMGVDRGKIGNILTGRAKTDRITVSAPTLGGSVRYFPRDNLDQNRQGCATQRIGISSGLSEGNLRGVVSAKSPKRQLTGSAYGNSLKCKTYGKESVVPWLVG